MTAYTDQMAADLMRRFQHAVNFMSQGVAQLTSQRETLVATLNAKEAAQRMPTTSQAARQDLAVELTALRKRIEEYDREIAGGRNTIARDETVVRKAADPPHEDTAESSDVAWVAARQEVELEYRRLRRVLDVLDIPCKSNPGVAISDIRFVEGITNICFDAHLVAMWQISDGSAFQNWFVQGWGDLPEIDAAYDLLSLKEALSHWDPGYQAVDPHDDPFSEPVPPRFKVDRYSHERWFQFAECHGVQMLFFDADPTPHGRHGQVLAFVHDPDTVQFVANSFIDFFRASNDRLERALAASPAALREALQ